MKEAVLIPYGARSAVARWWEQYWSPNDKRLLPWLCVILLGAGLFYGPEFLLWLVNFLPADQLGNSGASIRAHQTIVAIACVMALAVAAVVVKWLAKPKFISLQQNGINLIWSLGFIQLPGKKLSWPEITSINIFHPLDNTDPAMNILQFGTDKKAGALQIPLGQIDGSDRRKTVADAIGDFSQHFVEPDVFTELMPQTNLSFTELWLDALTAPPEREKLMPLTAGSLLDNKYEIVSRLGAGGQGTAYLALDLQNDKAKVVLKESILPVYANLVSRKQALESFHKEALALEAVKHPGIVRFLNSIVVDHRAYLVLEYLEGLTLKEAIESAGPMAQPEVIKLALQMCDILDHMHSQTPAVVHRDFSPDNLILNGDKLTLIDFAVSVPSALESETPEVAGKIAYMAPEQFQGKAQAQSDIYSLCGTLYYLLTAQTPDALLQLRPMLQNDSVDEKLDQIVATGTEQTLDKRYKFIGEVRQALQAL